MIRRETGTVKTLYLHNRLSKLLHLPTSPQMDFFFCTEIPGSSPSWIKQTINCHQAPTTLLRLLFSGGQQRIKAVPQHKINIKFPLHSLRLFLPLRTTDLGGTLCFFLDRNGTWPINGSGRSTFHRTLNPRRNSEFLLSVSTKSMIALG